MRMLCDQFDVHSFPKGMLAKAGEAEVIDVISAIKPDVILHTAAISDTGYSEAHPEESYRKCKPARMDGAGRNAIWCKAGLL